MTKLFSFLQNFISDPGPGAAPARSGAQGHPIVVNPTPNTKQMHSRNLQRMERIKLAMKKLEKKKLRNSREWKLYQLELERRRIAVEHYELLNEGNGGQA